MTTREQEERERNPEAFQLTPGQMDFAVRCMSEWIHLSGICPTDADVSHSSFLRRLLSGKDALDKPPPKRFSYPDYELGEGKPVKVAQVFDTKSFHGNHDRVYIDQYSQWRWQDKENGLLEHLPDGEIYKLEGQILQKVPADESV